MHFGTGPGLTNRVLGETFGEEQHTLLISEIPSHSHPLNMNTGVGTSGDPANKILSQNAEGIAEFSSSAPNGTMNAQSVGITGGGLPHNNMQPYLVLNWQIAYQGIFPSSSED
ncbi:MAG TPA: hypothetical protein VHP32_01225 [Ignavibacteria bacterium]|nr:hypothetical protein [Ignavibacteria bacterium]